MSTRSRRDDVECLQVSWKGEWNTGYYDEHKCVIIIIQLRYTDYQVRTCIESDAGGGGTYPRLRTEERYNRLRCVKLSRT